MGKKRKAAVETKNTAQEFQGESGNGSAQTERRKPHILIAGETLGLGGAEKVTVDLANALLKSGLFQVSALVTFTDGGLFASQLNREIKVRTATTGEAFVGAVREIAPDALLLNNCRLDRLCTSELAALPLGYLGFFIHGYSRWSLDLLPREFPSHARVLTISEEAAQGISRLRPDIPRSVIGVLPNGVDTERFKPPANGAPLVSPWPNNHGPVFGYCGRFSGEKALITMVDCFRRVKEKSPGAKLLLVGGSDPGVPVHDKYWSAERRSVEMAVRQMGLSDSVHITGATENPESFYQIMDVFLLTSHFEGVPLVLLEAMASGVPAICTAVGAIPSLLTCGCGYAIAKNGMDLDNAERDFFASKMIEVATNPARSTMGLRGRDLVVKAYSAERYQINATRYFKDTLLANG